MFLDQGEAWQVTVLAKQLWWHAFNPRGHGERQIQPLKVVLISTHTMWTRAPEGQKKCLLCEPWWPSWSPRTNKKLGPVACIYNPSTPTGRWMGSGDSRTLWKLIYWQLTRSMQGGRNNERLCLMEGANFKSCPVTSPSVLWYMCIHIHTSPIK